MVRFEGKVARSLGGLLLALCLGLFLTCLGGCLVSGSVCAEAQMISDGLLLDVVRSEGKVARGCVRASFGPVSGLIPHLFGCCLKDGSMWESS